MNSYTILAEVKRTTGTQVRLGLLESVAAVHFTEDQIILRIDRARVESRRFALKVRERGVTLYEWTLAPQGWEAGEPVTVWWSTDEVHASGRHVTPEDHFQQKAWEDDCYRPGTPRSPMDNLPRQQQGYSYGGGNA